MKKLIYLIALTLMSFSPQGFNLIGVNTALSQPGAAAKPLWRLLEPGLELAAFASPKKSIVGDSRIRVLRINPENFEFRLYNSSASPDGISRSARNWALKYGLTASINASMYQADRLTSVSLMKTKGHVNNPRTSKDKTIFAFDPTDSSLAKVKILDKDCHDFDRDKKKYASLIQSIRMISCKRTNVWKQQNKIWSIAAIGMDKDGNILFIHSRSPYSGHDFINILLKLPIHIKRAMYTDGGKVAQMFVQSGKNVSEFLGSYSTNSQESDSNFIGWPIPNVIGIVSKSSSKNQP